MTWWEETKFEFMLWLLFPVALVKVILGKVSIPEYVEIDDMNA